MNREGRTRDWLEMIAFLVLAIAALCLAIHDVAILAFPGDLIYGEGFLLRDAALLRAGQSPYTAVSGLPAVVANYPPIYPAVTALASIVLGPGFLAGRLVSILSTLACALLIWRIARRELGGGASAAFAPLIFLADIVVYYWSPYARVDMLALAFELLALDAFHQLYAGASAGAAPPAPSPGRAGPAAWLRAPLARGVAFTLLAVFTRPTAMAALAAFVLLAAIERNVRRAAGVAAAALTAIALVALVLSAATSGEFLRHTLAYNANAFRWGELPILLLDFGAVHAPLLLGAAAFFLARPLTRGGRLLAAYAAAGFALAFLVGKVGSSANYFLQAVAGASLAFGIVVSRADGLARRILLAAVIAGPLLATTVPWVRPLELRLNPFPAMGRTPGADDRRASEEILRIVRETPGEVLIEDAGFLVRAGKTVWAAPLVLAYLEEQEIFDPAPLAAMIRRREFGAIVLSYNFFSPSIRAAIGEAYRPERVIEIPGRYKYVVLRPAG